jgi:hypothetical protein
MATHKEIQKLIEASYKKNKDIEDVGDFKLDKKLSTSEAKVFHDDSTGKTVIANKGTAGTVRDWSNNAKYVTGQYNKTQRMKNARKVQKEAKEKYGSVDTNVGHSQSGVIARKFAKNGKTKEAVLVNPATLGERTGDNVKTVRSDRDLVSILNNKDNKTETIKSDSWNPLVNHAPSILQKSPKYLVGGSIGLSFAMD